MQDEACAMNALEEYQNEKKFFAQFLGSMDYGRSPYVLRTSSIRLFFVKPHNSGFKIAKISTGIPNRYGSYDNMIRMKPNQEEKEVSIFTAKMSTNISPTTSSLIKFRVKIVSTIYCFDMADTTWTTELLSEKQFTDVDILVGEKKFEAHRVVLSARSSVFKTLLSKISNTGRPTLAIGEDVDFSVAEQFLKYLYTGTLSISANNKKLLALAEMYQVETLKKMCQLAVHVSDAEDITTSFLELI